MKKTLLFSLLFTLAAIQNVSAQCVTLFTDGFESGTFSSPWTMGTGTYNVTVPSGTAPEGTYNLSLSSTGTGSFYEGAHAIFTAGQPTTMSWWMKTNTTNQANGYVVIGDGNIANDNGVIFCYFNATSQLRFFASTGYNHPIVANTWYHVEARNMNWTARTSDIYVNNVLILSAWPFRSTTATTIDRVHCFNLNGATAEYDHFAIGDPAVTSTSVSTNVGCFGQATGSATITAGGGTGSFTYLWSPGGETTAGISSVNAGTYTVVVTDGAGCTTSETITITEPPALASAAANSGDVCAGDTAMLVGTAMGGTPGYTYDWMPNNASGSTTTDFPTVTTTYTLLVTDANGCTSSATTTVIVNANPTVYLGTDFSNCGPALLDAGVGASSYEWTGGSTSQSITVTNSGLYGVTVTDSLGCSGTDSINVTINANPVVVGSAAMNMTCMDDADVSLFGSPNGGTWSGAGVNGSMFSPDSAGVGSHFIVYNYTDSVGCSGMDTVQIDVDLCLAVNENGTTSFTVYPNPNNGEFQLITSTATGETHLTITDVAGRVVYESVDAGMNAGTVKTISLGNEPAGIYLLQIAGDNATGIIRIVLTK